MKLFLLLAIVLASCAQMPESVVASAPAKAEHEFCSLAKPILIDRGDVLVHRTEVQIRDYNKRGVDLCGWGKRK
jgi:hypothetical protein